MSHESTKINFRVASLLESRRSCQRRAPSTYVLPSRSQRTVHRTARWDVRGPTSVRTHAETNTVITPALEFAEVGDQVHSACQLSQVNKRRRGHRVIRCQSESAQQSMSTCRMNTDEGGSRSNSEKTAQFDCPSYIYAPPETPAATCSLSFQPHESLSSLIAHSVAYSHSLYKHCSIPTPGHTCPAKHTHLPHHTHQHRLTTPST